MTTTAPLRPCTYPRCANLVDGGGRCPTHRPTEADRPNADVRTWYRTPRWRALRTVVLRDQPYCADCAREGRRVPTTDVDHIEPHRGDAGLFWSRQNLQALCHRHHSAKTGRGA